MSTEKRANVWQDTPQPPGAPLRRSIYVAISGNTGAGKSSLIEATITRLRWMKVPCIAIGERNFHHPLLELMFARPDDFAFGVELNFLLQRYLCLLRALRLGWVVVIERSHFDDLLFAQHYRDQGILSEEKMTAFAALSSIFASDLRDPDILAYLRVPPAESLARLERAEATGERAREFPSEDVKRGFVYSWHERYEAFFEELARRKNEGASCKETMLMQLDGLMGTKEMAEGLAAKVTEMFTS